MMVVTPAGLMVFFVFVFVFLFLFMLFMFFAVVMRVIIPPGTIVRAAVAVHSTIHVYMRSGPACRKAEQQSCR